MSDISTQKNSELRDGITVLCSLAENIKTLQTQQKEAMSDMRAKGFNVKAIRRLVSALGSDDPNKTFETDAEYETYKEAHLGTGTNGGSQS